MWGLALLADFVAVHRVHYTVASTQLQTFLDLHCTLASGVYSSIINAQHPCSGHVQIVPSATP
jgi:hypothetical protein